MIVSTSTSSTSYRCGDGRFRELLEDLRQLGNYQFVNSLDGESAISTDMSAWLRYSGTEIPMPDAGS